MESYRLDGRTAVVTGAGGNPGLGRMHALLLAERGARVVVNHIGRLPDALGYQDPASTHAVAREIRPAAMASARVICVGYQSESPALRVQIS